MTAVNTPAPKEVAALLVIGDNILSGRTKDKNIGYVAEYLTTLGIDLKEVRVVGNEESAIVDAINTLRRRYSYVFATGGMGPTHDDIISDCVAKAFGVGEVYRRRNERGTYADDTHSQRCRSRPQ
jgi:molybdopterin-biosynthesis enzyme MoeA-like protein